MKLADVIRQTRKEYRTSMNKIAAIKLVRMLTGRGLKEARDFFDWMDVNGDGVSAQRLAAHWCVEHWQDNEICGCPEDVEVVAEKSELQRGDDAPNGGTGTKAKAVDMSASPATCGFMTTMGICGHPLVGGKCQFIYHNGGRH